ncbi:hypothetical protein WISP_106290 [Willisornis vidua]|uniref:Uncharacterized protein n=1 Tax=Willisornis vidua TaxID=1566151 RepID=A0ABQ9D2T0_9PASS|nr:hypothetical protein WISP_106290 [Willisornis vidua]
MDTAYLQAKKAELISHCSGSKAEVGLECLIVGPSIIICLMRGKMNITGTGSDLYAESYERKQRGKGIMHTLSQPLVEHPVHLQIQSWKATVRLNNPNSPSLSSQQSSSILVPPLELLQQPQVLLLLDLRAGGNSAGKKWTVDVIRHQNKFPKEVAESPSFGYTPDLSRHGPDPG